MNKLLVKFCAVLLRIAILCNYPHWPLTVNGNIVYYGGHW